MNSLRFLLVHGDQTQSTRIAARLADANHTVLPTSDFEEAADALTVERFDAILMQSQFQRLGGLKFGLPEFSAHLRQMEQSQKSSAHIPVIALSSGDEDPPATGIDAVMPEPLDPDALTAAVARLALAVSHSSGDNHTNGESSLAIIDPESFREQVGYDNELLVEIIDLFLEERQHQEPEMREALASGEFEMLSRLAHTVKGSLSSLHALRAKANAQRLETLAKQGDPAVCESLLSALERDLAELEPELLALREVSL